MAEHSDPEGRKRNASVAKTTQEIAERVNQSLPLRLSSEDVQKNPEFVKLLTALGEYITDTGVSKHLQSDILRSEASVRQEKQRWLQHHTLHHELHEMLLDHQIATVAGTANTANTQFLSALKQCVNLTEAANYLDCHPHPDNTTTLLGLTKDDLDHANPHRKHMSSIQQRLIPEIEERLHKKCENLVSFHDSSTGVKENGQMVFTKASQLPAILASEKEALNYEQHQLKLDKMGREKQFWRYHQALMDGLSVLEKIITRHRLGSQSQNHKITTEWLAGRFEAMFLKIKLLEMQFLCDTYYNDTVQALNKIKGELESAIKDTSHELEQVTQALRSYEAVGQDFDGLVKEYTDLCDEVDNKKWALREFKHSLDSSIAS